jgi:chromosome segregation ATPase
MGEVIGVSSGIVTLLSLTIESSTVLYRTIKSLQNKEKTVRELRGELHDLVEVLRTLQGSIGNVDVDIEALQAPLQRCRDACEDFKKLVNKYTEHSTDERTSVRDWFKLRYIGEDISGFKNSLACHKSTITIALAYANLCVLRMLFLEQC